MNALSATAYALKYSEWMMVIAHVWLLYYYVSLALRENILRVVSGAESRFLYLNMEAIYLRLCVCVSVCVCSRACVYECV